MAAFTLNDLAARVRERATSSREVSYTRELLDLGVSHCAKKLGEEALELAIAAVAEDRDRVIAEAADLLYHLVVLLQSRGIGLSEVELALEHRSSMSGLDEKKSRRRE